MGKIKKSELAGQIRNEIIEALSESDTHNVDAEELSSFKKGDTIKVTEEDEPKNREDQKRHSGDEVAKTNEKLEDTKSEMKEVKSELEKAKKKQDKSKEERLVKRLKELNKIKKELSSLLESDSSISENMLNDEAYDRIDDIVDDGDWMYISQYVSNILGYSREDGFTPGDVLDYIIDRLRKEF
jgi:hypothetical protein